LGKHFTKLGVVSPRDIPRLISKFAQILARRGDKQAILNIRIKNKKGQEMPLECSSSLMKKDGKIAGLLVVAKDITERKAIEKSLNEIDEKYHSLANNVPVGIWTIDSKDNPIFLNPNVKKMFGFTPEEICQIDNWFWHERTHPEDRERVTEAYNLFFARRKTGDVEYRIQRKDGTWIWIHDRVIKVYEKDGVLYADGITWEIIEDKKTEKMLKEAVEKKQRQLP